MSGCSDRRGALCTAASLRLAADVKPSGARYRGGWRVDREEARWGGHRIRCSAATGS